MGRVHAFEFNDLQVCPQFVRDSVVEILGEGLQALDFGSVIGPPFRQFARRANVEAVLDLASGTGVPARLLCDWLGDEAPRFVLSDLHVNGPALIEQIAAHPERLSAVWEPMDASSVPAAVEHGARTIINAFHHFEPHLAQAILSDAVAQQKAVFIYEGFPRNLLRLLPTMPAMGPCVWLNPTRTRRDRALKAVFTYLLPIIPLVSLWDASVSVLRVYSERELMAFAHRAGGNYEWQYREIDYAMGGKGVVFTGIPMGEVA